MKKKRWKKILMSVALMALMFTFTTVPAYASGTTGSGTASGTQGGVAQAIENTWNAAQGQIKTVVNNVVFPVIDMVLAILFFVKLGTAYFDYRKHGQFEFTAPAILFACLLFTLTAPLYIWSIL